MNVEEIELLRREKDSIIEDLRLCISYTPNRENDLLCFMEQYLKADIKDRPGILKEIKKCLAGEEYENPFLNYYYYKEKDIEEVDFILDSFIKNLGELNTCTLNLQREIEEVITITIFKINEVHDRCFGELIDSWRNERLTSLIDSACKYMGYEKATDIIQRKRLW